MRFFVSKKTYEKRITKKDKRADKRQDGKRRTNGARSAPNLRRATARGARQGYIVLKSGCKNTYKKDVFFLKDLQKRLTKKDLQKTLLFVS